MFTFTYPKTKMLYNSLYGWGQDFSESLKENAESVLKRWEGRWMPGERRVTREAIHSHLEVLITLRYIRGNIRALLCSAAEKTERKSTVTLERAPLSLPVLSILLFFSLLLSRFSLFFYFFLYSSASRSLRRGRRSTIAAPGNQALMDR